MGAIRKNFVIGVDHCERNGGTRAVVRCDVRREAKSLPLNEIPRGPPSCSLLLLHCGYSLLQAMFNSTGDVKRPGNTSLCSQQQRGRPPTVTCVDSSGTGGTGYLVAAWGTGAGKETAWFSTGLHKHFLIRRTF